MKNNSILDKRPLVDYLLLEYLWRKRYYGLGLYVSENAITGDNFLYHGLDLADLTDRLYSLIQDGMFLLDPSQEHIGMNKVYFTKSGLREHLSRCSESEEYRLGNNGIYMRLSFKGGKTWEQKVKANWDQYYSSISPPDRICIESKNKEFLSKVLKVYLAHSILIPGNQAEFNIFKPWYPPFVYWKQFARGYRYRLMIEKNNFGSNPGIFKLYSTYKLKHWRWVWLYEKRTGLMLRPPEELYG